MLRFFLLHYPGHDLGSFRSQLSGIPFRPVRRLGSEFLGKRSGTAKRSPLGSEFLGKRARDFMQQRNPLELYPKRIGSEFLGKREDSSKEKREKENAENLYVGGYSDEDSL
jgi:hypothetical protein